MTASSRDTLRLAESGITALANASNEFLRHTPFRHRVPPDEGLFDVIRNRQPGCEASDGLRPNLDKVQYWAQYATSWRPPTIQPTCFANTAFRSRPSV